MRWLLALALLTTISWATAAPEPQLGVAPLTQKVFRDSKVEALPSKGLELWGAGNEKVSVQLVITAGDKKLRGVCVTLAGDLQGPQGASLDSERVALFKVAYVPDPSHNEYPDPLPALRGSFDVAAGANQPIWVKVAIPPYCPPGIYRGALAVRAEGAAPVRVPVRLHVWPFTLPVTPHLRTSFGIGYKHVLKAHKVTDGSPAALALKRAYYSLLIDHRLSLRQLPAPYKSAEGLAYLRDPRRTISIGTKDIDFLTAHGLLHRALFYPVDEPYSQKSYDRLIKSGTDLRQTAPAARIVTPFWRRPEFTATTPVELLSGITNVWCPNIEIYSKDKQLRDQLQQRRALGEEVWAYVCCGPGGAYCNFFINQEGIRHRLLFWQLRQHALDGLFYWQTTNWGRVSDPWEDITTFHEDSSFGDGSLLYPGARVGIDGPVSSQRLECILAGMQDIEYFTLLERVAGEEAVQQIIAEMVTDFTHYSTDDVKLEALRYRIGETLSAARS